MKKHTCEYCQKQFFEKTQYRIHLRRHTGERPYACDNDGCSKAYYEKTCLKLHKNGCNNKSIQERQMTRNTSDLIRQMNLIEDLDSHLAADKKFNDEPT